MTRPRPAPLALSLLLVCTAAAHAGKPAAAVHDVLRAPRPKAPEFFGLYLLDKKVGYLSTALERLPGGRFQTESTLVFLATVGGRRSERRHREVRTYEATRRGKLLGFRFEQRGDGGEQTLEGECLPGTLQVKRARPGVEEETLRLPACTETADQADAVRVALFRKRAVVGEALDFTDLKAWKARSAPAGEQVRTVGGVKTRLRRVTTLSEKENVPVEASLTAEGEVLEVSFGANFVARAEPEETAKTLEASEVFTLTRVTLPAPLPVAAHRVPGEVTLEVEGLPREFHVDTARQAYRALPGGRVAVTLRAPEVKGGVPFPAADPEKGKNLEATLAVESSAPAIRALAAKLVKGKPDAW
ncbi:MAG: transglutaminase domain-containing protein, partial [Deltaproteobacteria bacterium]|nr:transglutaminase domain-containing protein [Deltaproteobacteria bacterium]